MNTDRDVHVSIIDKQSYLKNNSSTYMNEEEN